MRLAVLSFVPPATTGLGWLEVYKRPVVGDPAQDVLVDRTRIPSRIDGVYPYYHSLLSSEEGATYVVDLLTESTFQPLASRLATEVYVPSVAAASTGSYSPVMVVTELVRRQYIVLETFGQRSILLRKKHSGDICFCRDDTAQQPTACETCYGTGYEGGYDVFFPFLFRFLIAGERIQQTERGLTMDQTPRAWTTIVPEIRDGDVVVRLHAQSYDRYRVTNPSRTVRDGMGSIPTIQEFSANLIERYGDMVYKFPVQDFVPSYTQPTAHTGMPEKGI